MSDDKEKKASYVVHGALTQCPYGTRPSRLTAATSHGVYLRKQPQLNKTDCVCGINIHPMGICTAPTPPPPQPPEPAKQNKSFWMKVKDLFFGKSNINSNTAATQEPAMPTLCVPQIGTQWQNIKPDVLIDGGEALLSTSFLVCAKSGGKIVIVDDGQFQEDRMGE